MSEPIEAIATNNYVLATQQAVTHDNSMSGNGTVDSPLGLNETVLWSGPYTPGNGSALTDYTISLSESISNFERIRIEMAGRAGATIEMNTSTDRLTRYITTPDSTGNTTILGLYVVKTENDQTHINFKCGYGTDYITAYRSNKDWGYFTILRVVGINRKAQ